MVSRYIDKAVKRKTICRINGAVHESLLSARVVLQKMVT